MAAAQLVGNRTLRVQGGSHEQTCCAFCERRVGSDRHRIWADRRRHFCCDHRGRQLARLATEDDVQHGHLAAGDGGQVARLMRFASW
jgi:hypothetical protein